MKQLRKILIILGILAGITGIIAFDAFLIAPSRFHTKYRTITTTRIPEQLDDMNILFFSDLDYGTFMDEARLNKLVKQINSVAPDVIIFGGDVYDYDASISDEANSVIAKAFRSLNAPYGKFAVYGDVDDKSEEMKNAVNSIYNSSDFEVLNNASISLHHGGSQSVTLVGIDNALNGDQDIEAAYSNVSNNNYVITVCHTPDSADDVPSDITNYFLAGHSHGGQAYYLFGAFYTPSFATTYLRGMHEVANAFTLDITNGVGTTRKDVRLFTNAEVVLYRLKHQEMPEVKEETKSTPTPQTEEESAEETPEATEQTAEQAADQAESDSTINE